MSRICQFTWVRIDRFAVVAQCTLPPDNDPIAVPALPSAASPNSEASIGVMSCGPLFLTLPTDLSTGHDFQASSGHGFRSA